MPRSKSWILGPDNFIGGLWYFDLFYDVQYKDSHHGTDDPYDLLTTIWYLWLAGMLLCQNNIDRAWEVWEVHRSIWPTQTYLFFRDREQDHRASWSIVWDDRFAEVSKRHKFRRNFRQGSWWARIACDLLEVWYRCSGLPPHPIGRSEINGILYPTGPYIS